jgi:hypothetical protein
MDPKANIIMQLREIWLKLSKDKIEIAKKLELPNLSDEEKEDFRQATEGAEKVYDAHLNNIAMNVKNNFYTWKEVEKIDADLASEIEKVLQEKD